MAPGTGAPAANRSLGKHSLMSSAHLTHQRCFNHALREAAARCPECNHCYCRECITEHEDRVICAMCLRKSVPQSAAGGLGWARILTVVQLLAGLVTAWLFFYLAGQALLTLDSSFHEGTLWQSRWFEQE